MYDAVVIGSGQAGLACGYYLRRSGLNYVILDDQRSAGGAWQHGWDSLTLFSPAEASGLPGWGMPRSETYFPTRIEVINYLAEYETRYHLNIVRPARITSVKRESGRFVLESEDRTFESRTVISATGTWNRPFIPSYRGRESYQGRQLHSAFYENAEEFQGKNVLVVGEGNSGAQILSEVSKVAQTTWVAKDEPRFLPDDVDGRVLFLRASAKYAREKGMAKQENAGANDAQPVGDLGSIVMVPSVVEARSRGVLHAREAFTEFTADGVRWSNGESAPFDAVIWCTGFRPSLEHLAALNIMEPNGRIMTRDTKSIRRSGLWLVGYGNWTGFASATLIGVGRTARKTVEEIVEYLSSKLPSPQTHEASGNNT